VNDTSPEIERMVHERLMALTGEQRFMIGVQMCEVARKIVLSSLPPDLSPAERRWQLFQRYYGHEMKVDPKIFEGGAGSA